MPEYTGVDLITIAKKENLIENCRIVLVSAMEEASFGLLPPRLFDSYLTKPYTLVQLLNEIFKYLENQYCQ